MRSRNGSGSRYSDHLSHSEADDVMHAAGSRGFAMGASNNGYARFGASAYAEEQAREERRTFRCAGCTLFAGFVLIVAGLSVMYSADYGGTKARVVDGYDEIVDAWTNTYSEPFAATTFEVLFGDATTAVPAHATHHVTPIDHASGRVHDYYPTAFEVTSLLEQVALPAMRANETMGLPADGWGDVSEASARTSGTAEPVTPPLTLSQERDVFEYLSVPREVVVRVSAKRGNAAANDDDEKTEKTEEAEDDDASSSDASSFDYVSLGARALVSKSERRSNGWKPCKYQHGGYYRGGMCTTYTALDTLCVKVSRDPGSGRWAANATYGGIGCNPKLEWRVEERKMTRAPVGGADPSLSTIRHLGPVGRVIVRSAHDPLIAALNITHGSMFFAEKEAGQSAAATVLLVVGFAFSVPGVLLSAPFASRAWRGREVLRRARGARREKGREEFDDVL
jgi:hypothetical protein